MAARKFQGDAAQGDAAVSYSASGIFYFNGVLEEDRQNDVAFWIT